ncbi:glycosyltransferase [Pinirhizobacter soli]|uniref:glycosyltransferase n=1 Tax=Pinirhizobacter soli TaxID=2786953 RepID=UPI00202A68D5|nr:glycosyltransferase [Pinirhizobacter soli]
MTSTSLGVIIPTRNRADLAMASIESALKWTGDARVRVLVSDNSTDASESLRLREFVAGLQGKVELIHPDSSLGMTDHWNFAINQALASTMCSHFMFLTDRMLFKRGAMEIITGACERWPYDVVCFTYDRVQDYGSPIVYRPLPRSFDTYRIASKDLLAMSSRMAIPSCLPRMLNSIAPREHLEFLRDKGGSVFASIAPDYNFCYATLLARQEIVYIDRSLLVNYAQGRSNGASFSRGKMSTDSKDFLATSTSGGINHRSPIPAVITVGNAVIHEYMVAKLGPGGQDMPVIQMDRYLDFLAGEVAAYVDPALVADSMKVLREAGWKPTRRYYVRRLLGWLAERVLDLRRRTFNGRAQALEYAVSDVGRAWCWFPHPARRYGPRID